jgi:hypothetical protein
MVLKFAQYFQTQNTTVKVDDPVEVGGMAGYPQLHVPQYKIYPILFEKLIEIAIN